LLAWVCIDCGWLNLLCWCWACMVCWNSENILLVCIWVVKIKTWILWFFCYS